MINNSPPWLGLTKGRSNARAKAISTEPDGLSQESEYSEIGME